MKLYAVQNKQALVVAGKQYGFEHDDSVTDFPVLVMVENVHDADGDVETFSGVVTLTAAARLVGMATDKQYSALDPAIRSAINKKAHPSMTGIGVLGISEIPLNINTQEAPQPSFTALNPNGEVVTISGWVATPSYQVGQHVQINGVDMLITAIHDVGNNGSSVTTTESAPQAGQAPEVDLTGITELLPINKEILEPKHKIADQADDDHVLDVERAI